MARPLRIEFAGALYHVTSRGDRQEKDNGVRSMIYDTIIVQPCAINQHLLRI